MQERILPSQARKRHVSGVPHKVPERGTGYQPVRCLTWRRPAHKKMACLALGHSESTTDASEIAAITMATEGYSLSVAFMLGADPERYGGLIKDLKNATWLVAMNGRRT